MVASFISGSPIPVVGAVGGTSGVAIGGLSPAAVSGLSVAALTLVPAGLVPIALFPPYEKPRTKPAVSVIFAEDPEIMSLNDDISLMRTRRSLADHMKDNLRRNYRRPSVFAEAWQSLLGKVRTTGKVIKQVKDEAMCAKTRLKVMAMELKGYFAKQRKKMPKSNKVKKKSSRRIMNSMDDCFSDMPEPMYGFKTQVTLVEDSPCFLGSTCKTSNHTILAKRNSE